MTVSRKEIIYRAGRRIGAITGTIASGTATTAVLNGLIGTTGDNYSYAADRLFMLDGANEVDVERLITTWTDLTGTATFATRADSTYTSENYMLGSREDYTLNEYRNAILKAMRFTKHTYRIVIPLTPNLSIYPLYQATWVEGGGDVDAVFINNSPIMLHNEDYALWPTVNPDVTVPDGWTLAGTGATIARVSTGLRSGYGAQVTRVNNDATLYQSIPQLLLQYLTRSFAIALLPWQAGAWVTSSTANIARIGIYNGSTTSWSSYHTGNGIPQFLSTSYTPTGVETICRFVNSVDTTNGSAVFHSALLDSTGVLSTQERDRGSQAYYEAESNYAVRNVGGFPAVVLPAEPARLGQLIVYTRRPFLDFSADTDVVDDQYGRMIVAGTLRFMLESNKPNQDRSRLDAVMKEEASVWLRETEKLIDLPIPKPPAQTLVRGA